jgi:tRNA (guanosine-2'-O-)-methyltransferase
MKQSDVNWQLSEAEKLEIEMEWMKKTIKSSKEIIERYYLEKRIANRD